MSENLTEGVGKRIVDVLKQQANAPIDDVQDNLNNEAVKSEGYSDEFDAQFDDDMTDTHPSFSNSQISFENTGLKKDTFASDLDDFDVPDNIVVLKQLINQLPAGVSKQTGALIIKQTMEALGISMKSVLQEAQRVQEGLTNSTKECQNTIVEYKKQIGMLEKQAQKYQRQYSALNDIISLFVQTNF
ncbi:hypothetical protein II810_04830 [bacterium]|nr:hypothetical protein [bacterium]